MADQLTEQLESELDGVAKVPGVWLRAGGPKSRKVPGGKRLGKEVEKHT